MPRFWILMWKIFPTIQKRIDVNTSIGGDWLHFNALDYNEELDIIAISALFC